MFTRVPPRQGNPGQVRAPMGGEELELARSMQLPVVWRRPGIRLEPTGLIGAWRSAGRKALHVVGGRGVTLDNRLATTMANGLRISSGTSESVRR